MDEGIYSISMEMPFSIIVPVYNVAEYLPASIGSVIAQTFAEWECICVDDGSTDGSGAILDAFAAKDNRLRIIHKSNAGVSAARNSALEVAKGDYVIFLDGDDALVPWALERLSQRISETKQPDILMYRHQSVRSHDEPLPAKDVDTSVRRYDLRDRQDVRAAFTCCYDVLLAWNGIYRREAVADLRFFPLPNGEDTLWGAQMLYKSCTVAVTSDVLYRYLARAGSAVRSYSLKHLNSIIRAGEENFKAFSSWQSHEDVRDLLAWRLRMGIGGTVLTVILRTPQEIRAEAWRIFFEGYKKIAMWKESTGFDPLLWRLAVKCRSRVMCYLVMRLPWKFRALVARSRFTNIVRKLLRRGGARE